MILGLFLTFLLLNNPLSAEMESATVCNELLGESLNEAGSSNRVRNVKKLINPNLENNIFSGRWLSVSEKVAPRIAPRFNLSFTEDVQGLDIAEDVLAVALEVFENYKSTLFLPIREKTENPSSLHYSREVEYIVAKTQKFGYVTVIFTPYLSHLRILNIYKTDRKRGIEFFGKEIWLELFEKAETERILGLTP